MTKLSYKAPQELKDLIEEELLCFGLISKPTENHSHAIEVIAERVYEFNQQ